MGGLPYELHQTLWGRLRQINLNLHPAVPRTAGNETTVRTLSQVNEFKFPSPSQRQALTSWFSGSILVPASCDNDKVSISGDVVLLQLYCSMYVNDNATTSHHHHMP